MHLQPEVKNSDSVKGLLFWLAIIALVALSFFTGCATTGGEFPIEEHLHALPR